MVTAASVSDVAVIVIDVTGVANGVLKPQTRRHAAIAALMGLNVIIAVNKMDLVGWSRRRFEDVRTAFGDVAQALGVKQAAFVPVSALRGDNIVHRSAHWSDGPTLLEALEGAARRQSFAHAPLRLPIQTVLRQGERRLYAGRIESGVVRPGDHVRVGPSALAAAITGVRVAGAAAPFAEAGASVAVELADARDLARGDVIADAGVRYTQRIAADLCWLDEAAWAPGRRYRLRQGTLETQAVIEDIGYVRDMATLGRIEAQRLHLNDIASVTLAARDPLLADLYAELPGTGGIVLFDPDTNRTCAAGMIRKALA
jgi:sulfate adenylyltransferase subunit 1